MAYQDDNLAKQANLRYIRKAMDEPLLERDHELDLARRWKDKGDEKALHELIRSYTRLVVAIAAKFKNYGLPMGDLIQEGNIGLMEAASRFKPEMENRFSTYASWWIKAQIQDYVLRNWSIVRTGTTSSQKSLFFNLRRLRAKLTNQSSGEYLDTDAIDKIATELRVSPKDVKEMEARMGGDWSLNHQIGEGAESEWQDLLADSSPTPEEIVTTKNTTLTRSNWLKEAFDTLNPREQVIIKKRHLKGASTTLEELGKELHVSKERIRQLEHRALGKMREVLKAKAKAAGDDTTPWFN